MTRLFAAALAVAALATVALAGAGTASSDSTTIPFHARIGNILGMIPLVSEEANGAVSNSAPASGRLYYNGGPVMHTSTVYTIYWQPSGYKFPSGYSANMNQYFKD